MNSWDHTVEVPFCFPVVIVNPVDSCPLFKPVFSNFDTFSFPYKSILEMLNQTTWVIYWTFPQVKIFCIGSPLCWSTCLSRIMPPVSRSALSADFSWLRISKEPRLKSIAIMLTVIPIIKWYMFISWLSAIAYGISLPPTPPLPGHCFCAVIITGT